MASTAASLLQEGSSSNPTHKWAKDAASHLATRQHWFCEEGEDAVPDLVGALLQAVPALDMGLCASLWPGVHRCCSSCLSCITGFHEMQERMEQQDCPVMGEAMMMQALERLQATLHTASTDLRSGPAGAAQISMEGVLAFLEVLAVWRLLGDKEVSVKVASFIHTMVDLHCDMDVSEHLPGMFVLAAHHDDRVREFVQTHMLAHLPKLTTHEDLDGIPNFWPLVDTWVMTMACGTPEGMYQLLPGREAYQQQDPFLAAGLATLIGACQAGALHALVQRHPDVRSLIIQRVAAMCRPGYDADSICSALQALRSLAQGLKGKFWTQVSENGSRMEWTLPSTANMMLDGMTRLRDRAPHIIDLTCRALQAFFESMVLPEGSIMPEHEVAVYEKVYALLTRVCRGITLLRGVPPEAQRQRVQLVQRGAWQILLAFARKRVCVAAFAATFLEFLRGALSHAQPFSNDLPQRLLVTVAWACLHLAAAVAPALHAVATARQSHTALTAVPSSVSSSNFVAARSRQEYAQGHQLAAQLLTSLGQLLGSISMSPDPLRALLLNPTPASGAHEFAAPETLAHLLSLMWSASDTLRTAAQHALCSVASVDGGSRLSDALLPLLKSPHTAAVLFTTAAEQLQAIAVATAQQLCSTGGPAVAVLEFTASLLSAAADPPEPAAAEVADVAWESAVRLLRTCVDDLRAAEGASHGRLYPREVDAALTAILRGMSVVWVTHKYTLVTPESPAVELHESLGFLELYFVAATVRPRMSADLREVWEAGLMAITGDLPVPAPWGSDVEAAAVKVVGAAEVSEALKEHVSRLLGQAAPDCVARVQVKTAIAELPTKSIIDLTTPTKAPGGPGQRQKSVLRTPERKGGASGKALSNSPLLSAWKKAQARLDQGQGLQQQGAEVGVVPIKAHGLQPLNFSRAGGTMHAALAAAAPAQARVPVATLYERAGLKQPPPRTAAAAAAEARAAGHTQAPAGSGPGAGSVAPMASRPRAVRPAAAAQALARQKRPRLRDIVNGVAGSDSDDDRAKGSDEEDVPLYKRRKAQERPPPISHGGVSRSGSSGGRAATGQSAARGAAAARPQSSRPARQPQPPPLPVAAPPVLSSQLIEKTAKALKAANAPGKKIKLAPLPSIGGRVTGARATAVAAKPAAPKTDLTHCSSERSFTRQLLSSDVQDFTSSTTVIKKLPPSFTRLRKYVESFEHLLMLEIQAQVSGSIAEGATLSSVSCSIVNVLRKDDFWEVTAAISSSNSIQGMLRNEDLVAVRVGNGSSGEQGEWRNDNSRLALIIKSNMSPEQRSPTVTFNISLKSFKNNSMDLHSMHKVIRKGSQLSLTHLLSVVPHMREVRALVHVHNLPRPLLQSLLQPTAPDPQDELQIKSQDRLPRELKPYLAHSFNDTQREAIRRACFHHKTSVKMNLIQGPPGTGKTSVICGVIACMLHGNTFKRGTIDERPTAVIGQGLRANSVPGRRVLVCAQSNAAIDELLGRLSARGLATGLHTTRAVSMLRLGSFESAHPAALQFHIDHVVDGLVPGKEQMCGGSEMARLRSELLAVVTKISKLKQGKSKEKDDLDKVDAKRRMIEARIAKSSETAATRTQRASREERRSVLRCAEVVVATLSAAGGDLPSLLAAGGRGAAKGSALRFDAVIIDEAAQAVEPATLIPMQLLDPVKGQLVLVGDPHQLPPTVLSRAACAGLSQSLFERLQRGGAAATLLRFQYRMHPAISAFPSAFFYDRDLLDGTSAASLRAAFHSKACLGPLAFFDVERGRQERGGRGQSLMNHEEVKLIFTLLNFVFHHHELEDIGTIGVIAAYKAQLPGFLGREICVAEEYASDVYDNPSADTAQSGRSPEQAQRLKRYFQQLPALSEAHCIASSVHFIKQRLRSDLRKPAAAAFVEVSTIDAFQGREADIIILSCVRAPWHGGNGSGSGSARSNVGFLQDVRRMNVALTRARRSLWVLGHVESLVSSRPWRSLAEHAAKEKCLYQALPKYSDILRMDSPKLAVLPSQV